MKISKDMIREPNMSMSLVLIPPHESIPAHYHTNCQTALYIIKGHGRVLTGLKLEKSLFFEAGDFIYIAPLDIHQPFNDSEETMIAVVCRDARYEITETLQ